MRKETNETKMRNPICLCLFLRVCGDLHNALREREDEGRVAAMLGMIAEGNMVLKVVDVVATSFENVRRFVFLEEGRGGEGEVTPLPPLRGVVGKDSEKWSIKSTVKWFF